MIRIDRNIENESSNKWADLKTVFEFYLNPKDGPLVPQKIKNDYKIKLESYVNIEGNKDNESCSTTWVAPKTVV